MSNRALFIVQNDFVTRMTAPVAIYARQNGHDLIDVSGNTPSMEGVKWGDYDFVFPYGSVRLLTKLRALPPIAPHLFWNESSVTAECWRDRFGDDYIGADGRVVPASDLSALIIQAGPLAVRPNVGLKQFKGGVYDRWDVGVAADLRCYVAPPSEIAAEYRVWFVGGAAVAASQYLPRVSTEGAETALAIAAAFAARHGLPLETIVVDVAETPNGWKIVELNSIHTAGWYAASPELVLDALMSHVSAD
jgi:hypothetical protein